MNHCSLFCPSQLAFLCRLTQNAPLRGPQTIVPSDEKNAPWLQTLQATFRRNPLLAFALSRSDRVALLQSVAAHVQWTAPHFVNVVALDALRVLMSSALCTDSECDVEPAELLSQIVPVAFVQAYRADSGEALSAGVVEFLLLTLGAAMSPAVEMQSGGATVSAFLSSVATAMEYLTKFYPFTIPFETTGGLSNYLTYASLALLALANTSTETREMAAGACQQLSSVILTAWERTETGNGDVAAAFAPVALLLSTEATGAAKERTGALLSKVAAQCRRTREDLLEKDVAEPRKVPLDRVLLSLCAEFSPDDSLPKTEKPLLARFQSRVDSLLSAMDDDRERPSSIDKAGVAELLQAFEQLDEQLGGEAIPCITALTPRLVSCACSLLRRCRVRDGATLGTASENESASDAAFLEEKGAVFDLWLALLQPVGDAATHASHPSLSFAEGVRKILTDAFLRNGGAESLVAYLALADAALLSHCTVEKLSSPDTAFGRQQAQLLSAWHLLETVTRSSVVACTRVVFCAEAFARAVIPFLLSCSDGMGDDVMKLILSSPVCAELLATALRLIPHLSSASANCVDAPSSDDLLSGSTALSRATRLLCEPLGDDFVTSLATLVSAAAAVGCVEVVTGGMDALVVLAGAFPYVSTRVVDFDFLSDSLEVWKVGAAVDNEKQESRSTTAKAEATSLVDLATKHVADEQNNGKTSGATLTIKDYLVLGTFRVMGAMVGQVPQAVNFEWIEILNSGIALLPFHRSSEKGCGDAVSLQSAYASAFLPCLYASVEANDEAAEYLFEPEQQNILWAELRERHREVAGQASQLDELDVMILSLACRFQGATLTPSVRQALTFVLPKDGEAWQGMAVPEAFAACLDSLTAATSAEKSELACAGSVQDSHCTQVEADSDDFVASAVGKIVEATSVHLSTVLASKVTVTHLINALRNQGPSAVLALLRRTPVSPSDDDISTCISRVNLLTYAIQYWQLKEGDAAKERDSNRLWKATSEFAVEVLGWYLALPGSSGEAFSDYMRALYCQQCLHALEAAVTMPSIASVAPLPTFVMSNDAQIASCDRPFLSALAVVRERVSWLTRQTCLGHLPQTIPAADLSLTATLLAQAATHPVVMADLLATPGWAAYAEALLPGVVACCASVGVVDSTLLLLCIPPVRQWFLRKQRGAYAAVVDVLIASTKQTTSELAVTVYKSELES